MAKLKSSSLLDRPIAFHPALARLFGSINAAIYWQQLHYWSDKGGRKDGFIYKTKEEIEEETTLTRDQQDTVRKQLEKEGYLETKLIKANGAPTLHYKVNIRLVENPLMEKRKTHDSEKRKTRYSITENTQRVTPSEPSSQKYEIVKETDDTETKAFSTRKVTNKEVMGVLKDFEEILEVDITGWGVNTTQRRAIGNLLSRGKIDPRGLIKSALMYVRDNRDDEYMKWIFSPDDLDKNWNHLKFYKQRKGD